jgi:aminobenzoyl-glutamate utilization protein B
VPRNAGVWYFFRETNYDGIKNMWDIGDKIAEGASLMTNTKWSSKVLGSAWPSHMNRTLAETLQANITAVGLPQWSEADIQLAKATQKELGVPETGLATQLNTELRGRESMPDEDKRGGGSDDIGDISWNVPTVSLSFPANFRAGPGHNWANAIAMATPIAHKGTIAGARVQAMTLLDAIMRPDVLAQAREYYEKVQTKDRKYTPLIRPQDQPAVHLNKAIMDRYRPEMKKYYYEPTKYKTYLEQLGIEYPTVRTSQTATVK